MSDIKKAKLFLPNYFKIVGIALLIPGIIAVVLRFYYSIKPEFLNVKVFAVYSIYIDTKYFKVISNNISEEIVALLILTGLFFIALSQEIIENEDLVFIRLHSFILSVYLNFIFILFSLFFVFGIAFIQVLMLNMVSFLVIYIIIFNIYLYRYKSAANKENET